VLGVVRAEFQDCR